MRILVVEDNDLVADAIARGLGIAGFAVDRAPSAELAATALAAEHFDLAVVDIGLPGEDGLTFVRRLRSQGVALPVLILTARETVAMRVEALDLGADDFLMKPFEQSELAARCRALIRRANLNTNGQLNFGRLRIDVAGRQLRIDDIARGANRARVAGARVLGLFGRPRGVEGAAATDDRELGPGDDAERGGSLRIARARKTGRRRAHSHCTRTGISP